MGIVRYIYSPFFGLAVSIIVQVLILRFNSRFSLLKSMVIGFFCGFAGLMIIDIGYNVSTASRGELLLNLNLFIYCLWANVYFHFVNMGETARRIRILRELYEASGGLTLDELLERYNAKGIIEKRIERLVHNDQIIFKEGKYYIKNRLLWLVAKMIISMKFIFLGKRSEFD
ncbi:MAG: hypothetical protein ABIJ41_01660 [Candidatus Omnitrophota bacterium]